MVPLSTPDDYLQELRALTAAEAKRKWREEIKQYWGNRCCYCGSSDNLTLDHVRPKALGGRDEARNLVAACVSCNRSKNTNFWLSWWVQEDSFNLGNFSRVLSHINA